jgi:hypothetical protein
MLFIIFFIERIINIIMKKFYILTIVLSSFLTSQFTYAKDLERTETYELKNYSVKVNPLAFIFGVFNGGFNYGVHEKMTLGIGGSFVKIHDVTGYGADLKMDYFLNGQRFEDSWYVSPRIGYIRVNGSNSYVQGADLGVIAGYNWLYQSGFLMNVGAGVGYSTLGGRLDGTNISAISGTHPLVEFNLGYAW